MGLSFERKVAIWFAAYGALVIGLLATQTAPLLTLFLIFGMFVLGAIGVGLFCVVLAYRRRTTATRGLGSFVVGLGVFYLVIGSLALAAFVVPSSRWPFMIIGFLLLARALAFSIARRVMKRRSNAAND
jgi:hypothetical protein